MASTGVEKPGQPYERETNNSGMMFDEKKEPTSAAQFDVEGDATTISSYSFDHTKRKLKSRHIQLIGIGGTIGTALFVQIGNGLIKGGPGSLFIAYVLWSCVILCVNSSMAEMVTYLPISSPFVRFAGRFVDEAFGTAAGWNFFVFEAAMVPFEIVACTTILRFWNGSTVLPDGAIIAICIFCYALINLFAVKHYGETEFWLALGKMLLIIGLLTMTFIVMVGGNPLKDPFGFRYWSTPGAFAEHVKTGDTGRFMGFLAAMIQASFTIAGPDYVSMAAGEAENPRVNMPKAYKAVFYRLFTFFVLGSLAVGIIVPYDNKVLVDALTSSKPAPGAAASPYVVGMSLLKIPVLPHIVNALILSSAFSAGNSYVYCASRCLYGLSLEGKAPRFLKKCNKSGVPYFAVTAVLLLALLSFLQVSNGGAKVLSWFVSLVTASQLINFSVMTFTFIKYRQTLKAQNIPVDSLPHTSPFQPYIAIIALIMTNVMTFLGGYEVFLPGKWDTPTFLFSYTMIGVFPLIYIVWKLYKGTKTSDPMTTDVFTNEKEKVDDYHKTFIPEIPRNKFIKYWDKVWG